jgi:hypothetical protein
MIFTLGAIHNEGDDLTFMNENFHKVTIAFIIMLPSKKKLQKFLCNFINIYDQQGNAIICWSCKKIKILEIILG